jgi:RNA polymerase sigma factor (sigma-70 family)
MCDDRTAALWKGHLDLVGIIAGDLGRLYPWVDAEERTGYAGLGLARAVDVYDPSRCGDVRAHLRVRGRYAAIDQMRRDRVVRRGEGPACGDQAGADPCRDPRRRRSGRGGLGRPGEPPPAVRVGANAVDARTPGVFVPARDDPRLEALDAREQCRSLLRRLPRRKRRMIEQYHLAGRSLREIAREEGVTVSAVSAQVRSGMRRLRECVGA